MPLVRKSKAEKAATSRAQSTRARERLRERGLVQVAAWVPAAEKQAILDLCARLRAAHEAATEGAKQ